MTKTKKLNKIIPAVLLSSAMFISTPNSISPIVANALESNNTINYADENCPLTFKFYSNGDDGQSLYVSENTTPTKKSAKGMYNNEITIVPKDKETIDDILIQDSDKVNSLKIDISKSMDVAKYASNPNQHLEVEFYINGDHDNPIYVLQKDGGRIKHINHLVIDDSQNQDVFIDGLSGLTDLEIKVCKCSNNSNL